MATFKHKQYDDDLLVRLIARGDMNHRAIGQQLGLSKRMVSQIARGQRRPELQQHIQATVGEFRKRAYRLGARSMVSLVAKHIKDGLSEEADSTHARKCREFAMNKFLDTPPPQPAGPQPLPTPGLTNEDYQAIAKLKGGPSYDEDDQAEEQE